MATAAASEVTSTGAESLSSNLGASGYTANGPMVVQLPEKNKPLEGDELDGHCVQETTPGKKTVEDVCLNDLVPEGSQLAFKISQMLNRDNNRIIRNWRHLAESLGVPSDVCLSFTCDQAHSPTEDLFDHLETLKPKMTIGSLKEALRSMGRIDLIQFLESEKIHDNSKIIDNPGIVDKFKEKLDIQSRTLSWTQLAAKCGIQKKIYMKFGKPKLGPTEQLFLHIRLSDSFESLTIKELKKHIEKMERHDVLRVLAERKLPDKALVQNEIKVETDILDKISELLDKDLRSTKNWRNLAVRLGIPNHVYEDFDTSKANNKNPTVLLLSFLASSQPNLKACEFIKHLKKIHRNDVVEELETAMEAALESPKQGDIVEDNLVMSCQGSVVQGRPVVQATLCENQSKSCASVGLSAEQRQLQTSLQDTISGKRTMNVELLSANERKKIEVNQLPFRVFGKVCAMLDAETPFFHDYRMLAERIGVSVEVIRTLGQKSQSPTRNLLIDYKLKIHQFLEILKEIGREDVYDVIESWVKQESSENLSNQLSIVSIDDVPDEMKDK